MTQDPDRDDSEPVPKLPRKYGFRPAGAQIVTILMLVVALIAVLALRSSCSQGVANFFESFDPPRDASSEVSVPPGTVRIQFDDAGNPIWPVDAAPQPAAPTPDGG